MDPARPYGPEPTLLVRQARGPAGEAVLAALVAGTAGGAGIHSWTTRLSWPGAVVLWLGDVSAAGTDPAAAAVLFTEGASAGLVAIEEAHAFAGSGLQERLAREAVEVARAAGCQHLEVAPGVIAGLGVEGLRRLGCEPGDLEGTWSAQL